LGNLVIVYLKDLPSAVEFKLPNYQISQLLNFLLESRSYE